MLNTFSFEAKRIYCNKKNIIILLFFLFFSLYVVNLGIEKYRGFLKEKKNFIHYEKQKIKLYINYEQYGAYGFRILFQPTSLAIFHSNSFLSLEGTIDTKEIVNISINHKGKSIFVNDGVFGDFSSMFYIFGSLLMLYFGLNAIPSLVLPQHNYKKSRSAGGKKMKFVQETIFSRLAHLNGYFCSIILTVYFAAKLCGILFTGVETSVYLHFSLYMLLFINFFYFVGMLAAVVMSFKKSLYIIAYALWFLLLFLTPEINRVDLEQRSHAIKSNETVNIKKLNNVMRFEKRYKKMIDTLKEEKVKNLKKFFDKFLTDYMKNEYSMNARIENSMCEEVNKLIYHDENHSILLPSSFYLFLAKECSSYGHYGYQDFLEYIQDLKDEFSHYFFKRRYSGIGNHVESFVKNDENIFKAACILPGNFWRGFALTFFYLMLILGSALYLLKRRIKAVDEKIGDETAEIPEIDIKRMENGKTYFSLCRDMKTRKRILDYLARCGAAIIEKLYLQNLDSGVTLESWIAYECRERGIAPAEIYTKLKESGCADKKFKTQLKTLGPEVLNRVYLEIRLAENFNIYVCDDFMKDVSKELEKDFKKRIGEITDRTIFLYIGSEMFDINTEKWKTPVKDARFFIVDFNHISLR